MKSLHVVLLSILLPALTASGAENSRSLKETDLSFRNEIQRAIEKGVDFLKTSQNRDGWWSTAEHPSVTALALSATMGEPNARFKSAPHVQRGYDFILSCAKPDGGIYVTNLANYNTSISMMALLAAHDPKYDGVLRRARQYLVGSQVDLGEKGKLDTPVDGGVGYGSKYPHSDMNNTLTALEALYYSKHLVEDKDLAEAKDLNWAAAIHFIKSCQNLPEANQQDWVSEDPTDRGGFVYYPGNSMAGSTTNASGKVALRSYGTISYAGLLSFIYADVKQSDPRVQAVMNWLRNNFSLEENPGMGPQGYFYYLHLMTKALNAAHIDTFDTRAGKVDWRKDVAMRLINLQKNDGSWQNDNGRWWEKDSNLVTAYAVMALEIIYRTM